MEVGPGLFDRRLQRRLAGDASRAFVVDVAAGRLLADAEIPHCRSPEVPRRPEGVERLGLSRGEAVLAGAGPSM